MIGYGVFFKLYGFPEKSYMLPYYVSDRLFFIAFFMYLDEMDKNFGFEKKKISVFTSVQTFEGFILMEKRQASKLTKILDKLGLIIVNVGYHYDLDGIMVTCLKMNN